MSIELIVMYLVHQQQWTVSEQQNHHNTHFAYGFVVKISLDVGVDEGILLHLGSACSLL
jgi:hypothetical protein